VLLALSALPAKLALQMPQALPLLRMEAPEARRLSSDLAAGLLRQTALAVQGWRPKSGLC
jgi:hypothetical protein